MISGMSYTKGIFFINNHGIAHATYMHNQVKTHYYPFGLKGILFIIQRLMLTLPLYLLLIGILIIFFIEQPSFLFSLLPDNIHLPQLPEYTILLYVMAYHFFFPKELRKYHGAEHKVFSYSGNKHLSQIEDISQAEIVNRNCSTNAIVLFFIFFLLTYPFMNGWFAMIIGWLGLLLIPRYWSWGDSRIFFPISAFFQRSITTTQPDERHLRVAILSYMSLKAKRPLNEEEVWESYRLEQQKLLEEENRKEQERIRSEIEDLIQIQKELFQINYDHEE